MVWCVQQTAREILPLRQLVARVEDVYPQDRRSGPLEQGRGRQFRARTHQCELAAVELQLAAGLLAVTHEPGQCCHDAFGDVVTRSQQLRQFDQVFTAVGLACKRYLRHESGLRVEAKLAKLGGADALGKIGAERDPALAVLKRKACLRGLRDEARDLDALLALKSRELEAKQCLAIGSFEPAGRGRQLHCG